MNPILATAVYLLCLATSSVCAWLLWRAFRRTRTPLLRWTALGFGFLALNNLCLVADLVLLPNVSLMPLRQLAALLAIAVLLYGFLWKSADES